jgi:hypothetical protein
MRQRQGHGHGKEHGLGYGEVNGQEQSQGHHILRPRPYRQLTVEPTLKSASGAIFASVSPNKDPTAPTHYRRKHPVRCGPRRIQRSTLNADTVGWSVIRLFPVKVQYRYTAVPYKAARTVHVRYNHDVLNRF